MTASKRVEPHVEFRRDLTDHPRVALLLLETLSRRLRDAGRKRVEFAAADTVGRVCSRLVELIERFGVREGDAVAIDLPITQEELAGWCGASREATAHALQTLRELGWVETGRRRLVVRDVAPVAVAGPRRREPAAGTGPAALQAAAAGHADLPLTQTQSA